MNHEQAMLMKSSRVSDLNTPWEQVLHLASRRVFPKRHTIDVSNTESPYFYYILSGTVRLAYVGANGEERTILYAGAGTLMNVPTIIAGDIKNTVVTCTERVEAAIFDAGLLTDRAFAAAHPDLLLNLIHTWSSIRSTSATPRLSARWAMYAGCFRKCPRSTAAGRVSAPT